jgi:tetratricopeptide (TPR) repeat protein
MTLHRSNLFAVLVLLLSIGAAAQQHEHGAGQAEKLGTVSFQTSCTAQAQPLFNRAVALLHSFEFSRAIAGFNAALAADPTCAMADWGIALSRWSNFFAPGVRPAGVLRQGLDAVTQAKAIGLKTPRETAYVEAVSQLYVNVENSDQPARLLAYRDRMGALAADYPDDSEASIFYALALAAAASPADKTYADLLKAGGILEKLFAAAPDHPGLAHYIIHSYDVPPLAGHALHMPSHTFTRMGLWQESIESNLAAAEVARREGVTAEELHSMDYRAYAYLQTGQDAAARQLLDALPEVRARFDPNAIGSGAPGSAGVFALAAIPARYALERGAWPDAAKLVAQASRYLYPEAMTYYAKAIGATRIGDRATARGAIEGLRAIRDRLAQQEEPYWAGQTAIQLRSASAWLAFAEGRPMEALAEMRAAADMEDATEKSAVTPGPLAPARELVGEMLLQMKEPASALKEFEATLEHEPNRFRALSGAARSALLAGNREKARSYYATLLKVCERADTPGRADLVEARRVVSGSP